VGSVERLVLVGSATRKASTVKCGPGQISCKGLLHRGGPQRTDHLPSRHVDIYCTYVHYVLH
jgi:hypothetical protein